MKLWQQVLKVKNYPPDLPSQNVTWLWTKPTVLSRSIKQSMVQLFTSILDLVTYSEAKMPLEISQDAESPAREIASQTDYLFI